MILKFNSFVSALALGSAIINPFAAASERNRKLQAISDSTTAIAGQYIVKLKKETEIPRNADPAKYEKNVDGDLVQKKEALLDFCGGTGGKPRYAYQDAFYGCSVSGISEETAKWLAADPRVERVEQDSMVYPDVGSWGIDRVDQRDLPLSESFSPRGDGTGVTAYIIDTGILHAHQDFGGRATFGHNALNDGNNEDCNGHGTHVASTVGGVEYGVAKNVNLVSVKVFGCTGGASWDTIIGAINWVKADKIEGDKTAVANMSLGGSFIQSVNEATASLRGAGVPVAVAAGNSSADACGYSPASEPTAITVGSTTNADGASSFSNFGSCLDIWAPGSSITAAWYTSNTDINTISGTSMASPHVCGGLAIAMMETGGNATDAEAIVLTTATSDTITGVGPGSPNEFLYVGNLSPTTSPTPGPPTAAPTPCSNGTIEVTFTTDEYPSESAWTLYDECNETVVMQASDFSIPYTTYTETACLEEEDYDDIQYTLTLTDSYGDGLYGADAGWIVTYNGTVVSEKYPGDFGYAISDTFGGRGDCKVTEEPSVSPTAAPTTAPSPGPPTSAPTPCPSSSITITVGTDYWPYESTWELVDLCEDNTTVLEGGPYEEQFVYYTHHYCAALPVGQGSYMFNFYDSYGDGILYGNYTVYYDDELVVSGGGNFGTSISHPINGTCDLPTEEPSAAPTTPAPTSNNKGCKDSPAEFHLHSEGGGKVSYKCEYLKSKDDEDPIYTKSKCKDDAILNSHCPKSCEACPMYKCKDSMATFYKGDRKFTCDHDKIPEKCDSSAMRKTCRGTCNFCDDIDYDEE